jgi:hypothetical protein
LAINPEQILCQQLTREAIVRLIKKYNKLFMFCGTYCIMTFHASGKDIKEAVKA